MTTPIIPQSSGIYKITCTANSKIYIGSSKNISRRWKMHIRLLKRNAHSNPHLQSAWNKYSEGSFTVEIIELTTFDTLLDREQYWLDEFKPFDRTIGFNIAKSAEAPNLGIPMSESAKEKLRKANTGKKASSDTIAKMSIANRGRTYTEEECKARSDRMKGNTHGFKAGVKKTEEERAYMSQYLTGLKKNITPEHREKITEALRKDYIVTSPDGIEMKIRNIKKFCKENGLTASTMCAVANGRYTNHKGWECRHA